ncbi:MAG: blue light sensor protein [Rhodobacteraceae bacterium CG17_big_fil_post_rev_8_21_14_2_50_63_15]|nr:BLUF domain-containing protein [Roseovarius sp.]PIV80098.1 MAG: blue light sensor protein [Rhodobacteraceae bacterium CG17_big_fil_post_rev_8_21_14_2_50_63_15]
MTLIQIIYASQPFGFDDAMLAGILLDARRCNTHDGITGALIVRGDLYLQLLEGPEAKVEATFDRIRRDDRHANAEMLLSRSITHRMFPDWAMLDDPAQSWVWSREAVAQGATEAKEAGAQALGFFQRLADQR